MGEGVVGSSLGGVHGSGSFLDFAFSGEVSARMMNCVGDFGDRRVEGVFRNCTCFTKRLFVSFVVVEEVPN